MAINKLNIENFKGIGCRQTIDIAPFTIFLGHNSSGKSTCLHALAALSQTVKIPNNTKPIVFDDEYAFVHLGRFIDVIHSKSYQDMINIGFCLELPKIETPLITSKKAIELEVEFSIKSSRRTQETVIEKALLVLGAFKITVSHEKDKFKITNNKNKQVIEFSYFGLNRGALRNDKLEKENIDLFITFNNLMSIIFSQLTAIKYLGPFRQQPKRAYQTYSSIPSEVGAMGEASVSILANEIIQSRSRDHVVQISKWLNTLKIGKAIDVTRLTGSNLFEVRFETDSTHNANFLITDLGYGMSQVLPVLVQCCYAEKNDTLLFEQPEIHLHPLAVRGLSRVFVDIIKNKNCKVIIETHSCDLLREVLHCIQEKIISIRDIIAYKVTRNTGETRIEKLRIEDEGEILDSWFKGFNWGVDTPSNSL